MSIDKRATKRVPVKLKVDWKSESTFLFENATNISEQGIFIKTDQLLKKGTILNLQFAIPDSKQKVQAEGKVVWINKGEGSKGMGIQFTKLSDVDRETILALVKRIAVLESK